MSRAPDTERARIGSLLSRYTPEDLRTLAQLYVRTAPDREPVVRKWRILREKARRGRQLLEIGAEPMPESVGLALRLVRAALSLCHGAGAILPDPDVAGLLGAAWEPALVAYVLGWPGTERLDAFVAELEDLEVGPLHN